MPKQEKLVYAVIATDIALFRLKEGSLEVLLIPVVNPHYKGMWGLPGGLISKKETADESVQRHMQYKAGIKNAFTEQLYTFSGVHRDKRSRVVSVAYLGLVRDQTSKIPDGFDAKWVPATRTGKLAYDHDEILLTAIQRLRSKLGYTTIIRHLLPRRFTFGELQNAYETILNTELDKRNFRKKFMALNLLKDTGEVQTGMSHRPAALYEWGSEKEKFETIL